MSSPSDQPASNVLDRPCVGCAELGYDAARCEDYHRFASRATPGIPVRTPAPAVKIEEDSDVDGIFTKEMNDWLDPRPRSRRQPRRQPRRQYVGPRGPVSAISRGAPANNPRRSAGELQLQYPIPSLRDNEKTDVVFNHELFRLRLFGVTLARRPALSVPADRPESVAPVSSSSTVLDIASTLSFLKDESRRLEERMAAMEQQYERRISKLERHIDALKKALE
ncbi:hypothetical protein N7488_012410 [Penicillium malachiteum]|nr:hypothetical protein N7488_012410 [Penicillium malachiteum]